MSKIVTIPLLNFNNFISDYNAGVSFRYRLVDKDNPSLASDWSPVNTLQFVEPTIGINYSSPQTLSKILGNESPYYTTPGSFTGSLQTGFFTWDSGGIGLKPMLPSHIDIVNSQTTDASASPLNDLFTFSWADNDVVSNFDIYFSWQSIMQLSPTMTATLSAPSTSPYTGTLTFSGVGSVNAANTLASLYLQNSSFGISTYLWAGPGNAASGNGSLGNYLLVTSVSGNVVSIQSQSTWTAGKISNVATVLSPTFIEYQATVSNSNSYSFSRNFKSSPLSAYLSNGTNVVKVYSEEIGFTLRDYQIVPGMTLVKTGGDGDFNLTNRVVSSVDYYNNTFTVGSSQSDTTSSTSPTVIHSASGYIEFYGDASEPTTQNVTSAVTQDCYWLIPYYVQALLFATTENKDMANNFDINKLLSISEIQSTYFGGYGTITGATTTAPFTATLSNMNFAFPNQKTNIGQRLFSTDNPGKFGSGKVQAASYTNNLTIQLHSTAAMTNGIVTNVRM